MLNIKLKGKKTYANIPGCNLKGIHLPKKKISLSIQPLNKDLIQMWVECLIN